MKSAVFGLISILSAISLNVQADIDIPELLQNIQGNSGGFITETAYLASPPAEGEFFGRPSMAGTYAHLDKKDYEAFSLNSNVNGNFEIGYSFERLGLGDWNGLVNTTVSEKTMGTIPGVDTKHASLVHNFNVRYQLYKENRENPIWPSLTAGFHFKWNESIGDIQKDLWFVKDKPTDKVGGAKSVGYDHNHGVEFTLVASKFFPELICGHPVITSIGLRNSDAIQKGLLGFAGERKTTLEANAFVFLSERVIFGWEYKQENDLIGDKANDLVHDEGDWWDICLAYVVNEHVTVAAGYANLGNILNNDEENVVAFQMRYKF